MGQAQGGMQWPAADLTEPLPERLPRPATRAQLYDALTHCAAPSVAVLPLPHALVRLAFAYAAPGAATILVQCSTYGGSEMAAFRWSDVTAYIAACRLAAAAGAKSNASVAAAAAGAVAGDVKHAAPAGAVVEPPPYATVWCDVGLQHVDAHSGVAVRLIPVSNHGSELHVLQLKPPPAIAAAAAPDATASVRCGFEWVLSHDLFDVWAEERYTCVLHTGSGTGAAAPPYRTFAQGNGLRSDLFASQANARDAKAKSEATPAGDVKASDGAAADVKADAAASGADAVTAPVPWHDACGVLFRWHNRIERIALQRPAQPPHRQPPPRYRCPYPAGTAMEDGGWAWHISAVRRDSRDGGAGPSRAAANAHVLRDAQRIAESLNVDEQHRRSDVADTFLSAQRSTHLCRGAAFLPVRGGSCFAAIKVHAHGDTSVSLFRSHDLALLRAYPVRSDVMRPRHNRADGVAQACGMALWEWPPPRVQPDARHDPYRYEWLCVAGRGVCASIAICDVRAPTPFALGTALVGVCHAPRRSPAARGWGPSDTVLEELRLTCLVPQHALLCAIVIYRAGPAELCCWSLLTRRCVYRRTVRRDNESLQAVADADPSRFAGGLAGRAKREHLERVQRLGANGTGLDTPHTLSALHGPYFGVGFASGWVDIFAVTDDAGAAPAAAAGDSAEDPEDVIPRDSSADAAHWPRVSLAASWRVDVLSGVTDLFAVFP